jgi:hypothetical protein
MACMPGRTNCSAGCCQCDFNGNPVTITPRPTQVPICGTEEDRVSVLGYCLDAPYPDPISVPSIGAPLPRTPAPVRAPAPNTIAVPSIGAPLPRTPAPVRAPAPNTIAVPSPILTSSPAQCKPENYFFRSGTVNNIRDAGLQCCSGRAIYGVYNGEFTCGDANTPDYSNTPRPPFIEGGGLVVPSPASVPSFFETNKWWIITLAFLAFVILLLLLAQG